MFGEDRAEILSGDRFAVADETSRLVAFPQRPEELSELMRLAASEGWRLLPAGAGTWLEMGNSPRPFQLIVSTERLNRILEYEPADLTATVEAGVSLRHFNRLAAEHRQFIPLDPFGDPNSTLGGVIATASSGPLRCAYGTPRDWLIGVRVTHADGKLTQAGGKVVKNVAGYDLCKLYTGSFGTLGIVSEMSFKLRTLPPAEKTLVFSDQDLQLLCTLVSQLIDSDVQPAACELLSPNDAAWPAGPGRAALILRFLGEPETIVSQIDEAIRIGSGIPSSVLSSNEAETCWRTYAEGETAAQWAYHLKLSGLPANLQATLDRLRSILPPASWRAHAFNGVVRVHGEAGWLDRYDSAQRAGKFTELRQALQSLGGQLVIWRAPAEVLNQLDVWGEVGATAGLMRALKEKFDPQAQLNPGRFVAGI